MKKIFYITFCFFLINSVQAQTTKTVGGTGADYTTLKLAFDAVNSGNITGAITLQIIANITETVTASLNASGVGSANYSAILIYSTVSGVTVSGNFNTPLVQFYGADNVTIDGRVSQTGDVDLTLINSNTGSFSSAIKYINSAENNIVKYFTLKSSCYSTGIGVIQFSSSNIGSGNDNNVIEYCNITNEGGNRPLNGIFTSGGTARENSGNVIRNNNFYDIFNPNSTSNGIMISYLSTDWTISGNSFYETSTVVPTGATRNYPIFVNTGISTISNNYIGGSAAHCGGSAMIINSNTAHYFCGIFVNGGTFSLVDNNTIQNINYTSIDDNPWDGIFINSGNVDVTGNTIGATTGNGSVTISTPLAVATCTISGGSVTSISILNGGSGYTVPPAITFSASGSTIPATATTTLTAGVVTGYTITNAGSGYTSVPTVIFDGQSNGYSTSHGMIQNSTGTVNIIGNNIGSVTTVGSNYYSHGFESIYVRSNPSVTNISYNLIGSLTSANSIYTSSTAQNSLQKQDIYGIYSAGTGTTTISDNTVANLTNAGTGSNSGSKTRAIVTTAGANTIQNNIVRNISTPNAVTSSASSNSIIGISQTCTSSGTTQIIVGNTVSDLSNTNSTNKVQVTGIYYTGPIDGTNSVSKNFVHSLSVSSSDIGAMIYGIVINSGSVTCANNIINLGAGISTGVYFNGIWDGTSSGSNVNFYFNSVYISGTVSGTTSNTAGLWNANNTSIRDYRNNIFYNARTGGSAGKHYAIRLAGIANLTIDYNDYYAPGSGIIGRIGTLDKIDLAAWKLATTQDNSSLEINPLFTISESTNALDYYTSATLPAVFGTGITTDYAENTRSITPKIGALELNSYVWQGNVNNDFATAANWTNGFVPPNGADISFAVNPDNHCVLDQNRTLGSITNAQSTDKFVLNGKHLTVTKNLIFSNSAQIDATASLSAIEFAGTAAQNIPTDALTSNTVAGLTINNSFGVTLNNELTISEELTLTNGAFTITDKTLNINGSITKISGTLIGGNSTNIIFGGVGANTILPSVVLNNLAINRSNGITLNGDVTVGNTLTLSSGTLIIAANTFTLAGNTLTKTSGNIDAGNSSLIFANSSAITLPSGLFTGNITNLKISGNGGLTSVENLTVNGILDLDASNPSATKGIFDFGTNTLTMGANATTVGIGDVTGIVSRTSFLPNIYYTFGNQFTTVSFGATGTYPTELKVKICIGNSPAWKTTAINRWYDFVQTGGNSCMATIKTHYSDSELNGNNESRLVQWTNGTPGPPLGLYEWGHFTTNSDDNWVSIANVNIGYFPTVFGQLENTLSGSELETYIWDGSESSVWANVDNWTQTGQPGIASNVIIPDASTTPNDPSLPTSTNIKTIALEAGSILNASSNEQFTINGDNGAWRNMGGIFNSANSKVFFTNSAATIAGITNFYDVTITDGAKLTTGTNSITRIAGAISLSSTGIFETSLLHNVIPTNVKISC